MNFRNGLVMKFPVEKLLEKLKENRQEHEKIIEESRKSYIAALRNELSKKLESLERHEKVNPNSQLPVPKDNLEEYDTAISMLSFTTDKEVELTQDQYHCYVEDKWAWQRDFLNIASQYSSVASAKLVSNKW